MSWNFRVTLDNQEEKFSEVIEQQLSKWREIKSAGNQFHVMHIFFGLKSFACVVLIKKINAQN